MRSDLLDHLQMTRAQKRSAVLVTRLSDGVQALIVDGTLWQGSLLDISQKTKDAALQALKKDQSRMTEDGLFLHVFNPPLRMIIVGAVHITQNLVPMARMGGYCVSIIDPRKAWASSERFPDIEIRQDWPEDAMKDLAPDHRTAVIALTHDPKLDDPALGIALASEAFYIGALGSKKTAAARAERLGGNGISQDMIDRIDGPVGLNIGAVSPAEIAISIMGKVTLALRGPKG